MNIFDNSANQSIWDELASLKKSVTKAKNTAIKKRLAQKSQTTDLEYILGAFMEMYEPHLTKVVHKLAQKGYAIDASSGFGGKNSEFQVISGDFSIDYININKLEKIGVRHREYNGFQSLIFWPKIARIDTIVEKWMEIIDILPDKGMLVEPSMRAAAIKFRRKYIPHDLNLQKQRLFDKLKYKTLKSIDLDVKRRKVKNPHPDKIESVLGFFIEELEPQVRQAILELNRKGYSTDSSGFMNNSCDQMIEGDFQLDEKTTKRLNEVGVQVETNPSGYTRLQFSPPEANLSKIKRQWNKIISLIPNKNEIASVSMTRNAREFRTEYQ